MKAEITYNTGKSYRIGQQVFKQNRMEIVTDPEIVKRAQETNGFSVRVVEAPALKVKDLPNKSAIKHDNNPEVRTVKKIMKPVKN